MSLRRTARRFSLPALLAVVLAAALLAIVPGRTTPAAASASAAAAGAGHPARPVIVLEHGAWADASSWSSVISQLQRRGFTVYAPPNPLRGLPQDSAYLHQFLTQNAALHGQPVVLVGHSYGGAVITRRLRAALGRGLLALHLAQPVRGGPPLNDEHRGLLVEVGVDDLGDVGVEAVAAGSRGAWPGMDRPPGDLRLTGPLRFGAGDRVDRGAVQGEPRIPAQIRSLSRARHRAEGELAVLERRLDPGDPRRPVGPHGRDRLVPVQVEESPHALRELRCRALDVPPRRHALTIAQAAGGQPCWPDGAARRAPDGGQPIC